MSDLSKRYIRYINWFSDGFCLQAIHFRKYQYVLAYYMELNYFRNIQHSRLTFIVFSFDYINRIIVVTYLEINFNSFNESLVYEPYVYYLFWISEQPPTIFLETDTTRNLTILYTCLEFLNCIQFSEQQDSI